MTDTLFPLKAALADRYAIERELGAGGMATVYLGQDLKHKHTVAAKVLRPEAPAVLRRLRGPNRYQRQTSRVAALSRENRGGR